jgi:hypothetical protein
MATPGFSGSAADMLKQYGKAVPAQQPMSSLADAQAAKAKMDAEAGAHHHGGVACTEDHGHAEDHGHSSGGDDHAGCTEDHDHGEAHGHAGHDHAACDGDHGHAEHGHAGHDHAAKAPAKFEGCAKGKYAWTDSGTSVAKDDMGSAIRDYAFSDGPKKASVYVDLDGLDALSDDALTITKVSETRVEFSAAFASGKRSLTLSPLHAAISAATLLRKPGKNRVILKLKKAEPAAWGSLLVAADPGPPPAGGGMPGGMGGGMGMGGMGGMDMESMMKSMAGMAGVPEPPDLGADAPGGEEDLDDLPDLEEDEDDEGSKMEEVD